MSTSLLIDDVSNRLAIVRDARARYKKQLAPDFNIFKHLMRRQELELSRILADLLDPKEGVHCQGPEFLLSFVSRFSSPETSWRISWRACGKVAVNLEHRIRGTGRRMDVLIESESGRIGIENKPFAADQPSQMLDYAKYLDTKQPVLPWLLIYLSPQGRAPSEISVPEETWTRWCDKGLARAVAYTELVPWLGECVAITQNEFVRSYLIQLQLYIGEIFGGFKDMAEQHEVRDAMMASTDSVESALAIQGQVENMKLALLEEFRVQLADRAKKDGWRLYWQFDYRVRYTNIVLLPDESGQGQGFCVAFQFFNTEARDMIYGIMDVPGKPEQSDDPVRVQLAKALESSFGSGRVSDRWPWFAAAPQYRDWANSDAPWIHIKKNVLSDWFVSKATEIRELMKSHGLYDEFVGRSC